MHTTSPTLLEQVRANRDGAWERFVSLYCPLIMHWLSRAGITVDDREDLCQDVCLRVFAYIGAFRPADVRRPFRSWLRTLTRSRVADYYEMKGRERDGLEMQRVLAMFDEEPDEEQRATEEQLMVARVLALLRAEHSPRIYKAFWETTANGRTISDVSDDLGMSPNQVALARSRLIKKVRDLLDERIPGSARLDGSAGAPCP